jgi:hypothetical protein
MVRHPPRGDIMEDYKETFRLSTGFVPGFRDVVPKSIAMHERVLKTPSFLSRANPKFKSYCKSKSRRKAEPPARSRRLRGRD